MVAWKLFVSECAWRDEATTIIYILKSNLIPNASCSYLYEKKLLSSFLLGLTIFSFWLAMKFGKYGTITFAHSVSEIFFFWVGLIGRGGGRVRVPQGIF